MKQSAVYTITDYTYDKSTQKFSYLEVNHESVPLEGYPSSTPLYAWVSDQTSFSPAYFSFGSAPASAVGENGIFLDTNEDSVVVRKITADDGYSKVSDTTFTLTSAGATFTRDSTKDIIW